MLIDLEKIWQEIEGKTEQFASLRLQQNLDYEKFAIYSIITHSTAIEGSTLTEQETEVLFESGLTAKGKPLEHHLMNADMKLRLTLIWIWQPFILGQMATAERQGF